MQGQQAAQRLAAERQHKAAERMAARKAAPPPTAPGSSDTAAKKSPPAPRTEEEIMAARRTGWLRSRIVSLRGLGLSELPDLQLQWHALGLDAAGQLQAMDVGNNALTRLPGVFRGRHVWREIAVVTTRCTCFHNSRRARLLGAALKAWLAVAGLQQRGQVLRCNASCITAMCTKLCTTMRLGEKLRRHHAARADAFGPLRSLRRLRCSHNRLADDGVPWSSLGALPSLAHLLLDQNNLTTLPPALFQAGALRVIDCSSNRLVSVPADIRRLTSLEELDVSCNLLPGLPDALGAAARLHTFGHVTVRSV